MPDEELGSLYDLLIDDPPDVRRAIGELVYDHLIAQKFNDSQSRSTGFVLPFHDASGFLTHKTHTHITLRCFFCVFAGSDGDPPAVHISRMLQILKEFATDPILSSYVIDDVWDYMAAMKVCNCESIICYLGSFYSATRS